jgi:PTH1 family peptidyl-tRNA hydrolase
MSKYLIVGLGNPGPEYSNTRHNIGFKILDALCKASNIYFSPERLADCATLKHKGRTLVLIKPATFMNLSGKAVNYWLQHEKISVENLLVITDDIALPFGTLRLKGKGGDGGHNGLKSIQETLQTQAFARLRFGVGSEFSKGGQADYVLGNWTGEETNQLEARTVIAADIIKSFSTTGLGLTMTQFNNK